MEKEVKPNKKSNTEEFIARAKIVHGTTYDYSQVVYTNTNSKVKIVCKCSEPPHVFLQSPKKHLSGQGCTKVGRENCRQSRLIGLEKFIELCNKTHNSFYDYSKVQFTTLADKVTIVCPTHGEFSQAAIVHKHGGGCQECFNHKRKSSTYAHSTEYFIARCRDAHKNSKYGPYDYSQVKYINAKTPVSIVCAKHGLFSQVAEYHSNGYGCPRCATSGYKTTLPGTLYVLNYQNITKIGITNKKVKRRLDKISRSSGIPFQEIYSYSNSDGKIPKQIEYEILTKLRASHNQPTEKFDGYTECFLGVDPDKVIGDIVYRVYELTEE